MSPRRSRSSLRLVRRAGLCGALMATSLAATAVPTAGAAVSGETNLTVVSKGKASKSLRSQGVSTRAIRPATLRRGRLTVPAVRLASGRRTTVTHRGGLLLRRGKQRVGFRALQVRIGERRTVVARAGRRRITLFTIRRGRLTARSSDTVRLAGGTAVITRKAARLIKGRLRLRRLPVGALGRSGLSARSDDLPAQGDQPGRPGQPAPSDPPRPAPDPPAPGGETPIGPATGSSDWVGSTLPEGQQSLKSWINYILRGPPGSGFGASVEPSEGAGRIAAGNDYDYRLPVVGAAVSSTGERIVQHSGRIRYHKPQHGIDNQIANLRMVIAPDGRSGRVLADGQYQEGGGIGTPGTGSLTYRRQHVLDLDLTGVTPQRGTDGSVTYQNVPAKVSPEGAEDEIPYVAGTPWGSFTITANGGGL